MKILVIRYSGLGDVIMLLQTLEKLKIKYHNSHITLLTDKSNSLIKNLSCKIIDDVIPFDRNIFRKKQYFTALKECFKLFIQIRKNYDLVIDFQCFGETATISYLSNAKEKFGAIKKEKYKYGYTSYIKKEDYNHRSQLFSRIAQVNDSLNFSKLCLNTEANHYKLLIKQKLDTSKKTIGINIGATQENRRWKEKNFAVLQKILGKKYNILIFIGSLEKKYKYAFQEDSLFIEDVNLVALAGAISLCELIITNDTGPAHMAAALNIPTLTLFSTGEDWNVGVLSNKKEFIKNTNIDDITVDEVLAKFSILINTL